MYITVKPNRRGEFGKNKTGKIILIMNNFNVNVFGLT
jgi:hypothetical protein